MRETTNQSDHHRPQNYAAIAAGDLNRHQLLSHFFTFLNPTFQIAKFMLRKLNAHSHLNHPASYIIGML